MKRSILIATLTAAAFCLATTPAFSQHGRPTSPGAAGGIGGTHGNASPHSGSGNEGNSGSNSGALSGGSLNPNSKLSGNLANLLTKMGVSSTPQQACANFRNLGQCVAAIHVANNLKLDFASLQCDMTLKPLAPATSCPTGTGTGTKGMSLGGAIQTLDPNADSKSASKQANQQAKQDLKGS
jgi:hypothetical protein